jgi:Enoyl-(Acyl carrier protein) reductase
LRALTARERNWGGHYYSAAKAAAIHLTRCAPVELGEKGIRVNSLSPGPIATGIFGKGAGLRPDEVDENPEYAEAIATVLPRWQPLPYVGPTISHKPPSDASRMVTGHNLVVDGGITAGWPVAVARDDIALFRRTFRASRARRDLHKPKPVRSGVTTLVQTDRELATGWLFGHGRFCLGFSYRAVLAACIGLQMTAAFLMTLGSVKERITAKGAVDYGGDHQDRVVPPHL